MERADLFRELLRLHKDKTYRFALRLAGNADQARDLTQEAFVRALKNIGRYDPEKPFEAWIFTILSHLYINAVSRYEARNARSLDEVTESGTAWEPPAPDGDRPDRRSERGELRGAVQEALNRLPIVYRAPLVLCDMEGMSYEDIARALMCPVNTVRTRIHRARKIFKAAISPYWKEGRVI
ncbi:MAG: RNA polymerase sigma factor [Elusimicrobiota bacterium]